MACRPPQSSATDVSQARAGYVIGRVPSHYDSRTFARDVHVVRAAAAAVRTHVRRWAGSFSAANVADSSIVATALVCRRNRVLSAGRCSRLAPRRVLYLPGGAAPDLDRCYTVVYLAAPTRFLRYPDSHSRGVDVMSQGEGPQVRGIISMVESDYTLWPACWAASRSPLRRTDHLSGAATAVRKIDARRERARAERISVFRSSRCPSVG